MHPRVTVSKNVFAPFTVTVYVVPAPGAMVRDAGEMATEKSLTWKSWKRV